MKALEASLAARKAIEALLGKPPETTTRCEKAQDGWEVQVEVMETKGRLADNDILASFVLRLDADGDLDSYQRVRRYTRSGASILAA